MDKLFEMIEKNIDDLVDRGVSWSQSVSDEEIKKAENGTVQLHLMRSREIPADWLPASWKGLKILCLAGAGGQQAPLLAMAGAEVTVLDLSEKMLEKDRAMAQRYRLNIRTVHGNMCNMACFGKNMFDMIINPPSLMYVPDVSTVFYECGRILKRGGTLITAAPAPVNYLCEYMSDGDYYKACNRMPYKSYEHADQGTWIEFGHTMEDYLGGLICAGFLISGYMEEQLEDITELTFAVRAVKP